MRAYELHARPKQVQRSKGRSSVAAAAYRSASLLVDEHTGLKHDYRNKGGVEHTQIHLPDNAPAWAKDRGMLWNGVEEIEKKSNSMTAREWQIAFPSEFNKMQRLEAGTAISKELINRYNCAVDIAYHEQGSSKDEEGNIIYNENFHAHILYTTRGFDEEQKSGWSKNKYRDLSRDYAKDENGKIALDDDGKKIIKSSQEILYMREFMAGEMNRIAKRDKLNVKTEHLSFKQRGIDKEPSQHLGTTANEMEKEGKKSERGNKNSEIKAANDNRSELKKQKKIILLDHERDKRKLEQEHQKTGLEKVTDIYKNSLNGEAFKQSIELENIHLAKGKTGGFVLVDDAGNIQSLVKNIEG